MQPRSGYTHIIGGALLGLVSLLALAPSASSQPLTINTTNNQIGRLTSTGNGQVRRFFEYDALGRAARTEHRMGGGAYVFATTFGYPQGSGVAGPGTVPRSQSFPDGEVVAYGYDASGAQRTVTSLRPGFVIPDDIVRDMRRNARGQTVQVVYGNGSTSTHTYKETTDLQLDRIQTTSNTGIIQDYVYSFDPAGNVTGVADGVVPSFSATYTYDSLDRLASMTSASVTRTYGYDTTGNLTSKEGVVQTYGGTGRGPHALAAASGVTYSYDFNGNVIGTSAGLVLTWNAENMATVATVGGVTKNRKSFLGESLWKKTEDGVTTLYLPSLLLENGQPRKFFATFAERSPDGSLKFYHGDHLGSSTVVTDGSQAVVRRIAYMPFGEERGVAGGSFVPRHQFNFKEKESTGFYDYGARLYNPATGRWLSADSSVADGPNRYSYVDNNPLRFMDPSGRQSREGVWGRYNDNISAYHYRFHPGKKKLGPGWEVMPEGYTYTDDIGQRTTLNRDGTFNVVKPYTKPASFTAGFLQALTSPHDLFAMALGVETRNMRILREAAEANPKTAFAGNVVGGIAAGRITMPGSGSLPQTQIFGLRNGTNVYNIGSGAAIKAYTLPGERILNLPTTGPGRWTMVKNDRWVWNIIDEKAHVNLLSPRTYDTLWDASKGRWRVLSRELVMLEHSGIKVTPSLPTP